LQRMLVILLRKNNITESIPKAMQVSYYNYKRMHQFLRPEIRKHLEEVLSLDTDAALFDYQYKNEEIIGKQLGPGHAVGLSCGTAALQFSLIAHGIGKGHEVLTVPNTYVATALSVFSSGATPRYLDADPKTLLMDTDRIEDAVTEKTKAIIPVHLYGQMVDMKRLKKIADRHNLKIIEDACQAHFARFNGKSPGTYSDAACYSFFINKGLGGIGNGGMALTGRVAAKRIRLLRNPTADTPLVLKSNRTPAYLDWMQIAFIKAKLGNNRKWIERRRGIARIYTESLSGLPIRFQETQKGAYHTYRDFIILTKKRDKLQNYLRKKGIETIIHYPKPLNKYCYMKNTMQFPVSENACKEILSLPCNPFLNDDEILHIISAVRGFWS
jgi:dTDP-4-amino-4,6-dideoxygalactose transaminase